MLLERGEGFADLGGLVEGAQAAAANLDRYRRAVAVEGLLMNIGLEASLGVPVGVADVVAAHPGFQTNLATHIGISLFALARRPPGPQCDFFMDISD